MDNANSAPIVIAGPALGTLAFEWLYFPTLALTALGTMSWFLHTGQHVETASFVISVSVLLITMLFERVHPLNPQWNQSRGDLGPDFSSLILVGIFVEGALKKAGPLIALYAFLALDLPQNYRLIPDSMPLWAETLLVLLIIEFAKYWFHRMGHENLRWWPLHSVHHSVKRMHLLNGFRIHPLYHLCTFALGVVPCYLIGASQEALILNSVLLAIGGSIQHCNIKLRYGWLNYVFNTNELHRWHHSKRLDEANHNYGAVLIVWDVMFGTHYYRPDGSPQELGIHHEERYPMNNYWKQLLIPFRWKAKMMD
ncbi:MULTISPECIES: sterol desaturase family protein [unclassified Ketobacter]|uniref:sterol desaturase family protein n=1 Tax=unclassified Ketobacter TaxID=2639109 RepID=UPI000F1EDEA6|nr:MULTISPECIES: sterol desaturase family protein [unclassified Ketobacter]RLT87655.1 MAG: sterol desaturase family protein [Ketobacter sp. GenoA1]RLT96680.1 MAG: sterol desaturase family protein [Ketobacter sp.]